MIVETMNYLEIVSELNKATKLASEYTDKFLEKNFNTIRREIVKNNNRENEKPILAKTRYIKLGDDRFYMNMKFQVIGKNIVCGHDIYYVVPNHWKRKDLGVVIKTSHFSWARLGDRNYGLNVYSKHFFERYIERYLKDPKITIKEAIEIFFRDEIIGLSEQHTSTIMDTITKGKYKGCFIAPCVGGLRLMKEEQYPEGYVIRVNTTFVSDKELFKNQIDRKEFSLERGNEISGDILGTFGIVSSPKHKNDEEMAFIMRLT